jgi:hypothetical protein
MNLRLSMKQNLLVEVTLAKDLRMKNAGIQSYTTMVGFIEDGKVIENGKYSRTTGKHMGFIRSITQLPVVSSKEKRYFGWLWEGVKISHPYSISSDASVDILSGLSQGKTFFECVVALGKLKRKDKEVIDEILDHYGIKSEVESFRKIQNSFALV